MRQIKDKKLYDAVNRVIDVLIASGGEPHEYDSNDIGLIVNYVEIKARESAGDFSDRDLITLNRDAVCDCFKNDRGNMVTGYYCTKHKQFFSI